MAKSELEIRVEEQAGATIVTLDGPVDSATFEAYRSDMSRAFRGRGAHILLDCTHLTYMNSKSIGLLVKLRRQCYVDGGRVALFGLNDKIVRTMDLLGLGATFKAYATREEALAALNA